MTRRVVLVCGPPGAGKTTLAQQLGLEVYDRDEPQWNSSESLFRAALARLRGDREAQAVVIRTGATRDARRVARETCGATETIVLDVPADVCVERIRGRRRINPPISAQIRGVHQWWSRYEPELTTTRATSREW